MSDPSGTFQPLDRRTAELLAAKHAETERLLNGVRAVVLGLMIVAAAVYVRHLTPALTFVNVAVLAPMVTWTVAQHIWIHARGRRPAWLSPVNACADVTAVTALLLGYGLVGQPDLAVKSPIWVAYFIILAARPVTASAQQAAIAGAVATLEYAALSAFFTTAGHLPLLDSPLQSVAASGTSLVDEGAKLLLLALAGAVSTYATAWRERTMQEALLALRDSESDLRALLSAMSDSIVVLDRDGRYRRIVSSAAEARLQPPASVLGRTVRDVLPPGDADALLAAIQRSLDSRHAAHVEYRLAAGGDLWVSATLSPISDDAVVCVARDLTERKMLEEQLTHQAFHDSLTGLANRALFRDRVQHALAGIERHRERLAVLFLDLDDFKTVNDTLGHARGDELLALAAARIRTATRDSDTVARLGGDEFAVLLEHVRDEIDPEVVADRVLAAFGQPIVLHDRSVRIGISIGVARADGATTADELLRNADLAMYAAKSRGKGCFTIFTPQMLATLVDRISLEADLRRALEQREFRLEFQPIVDLEHGGMVGAEALVRWAHPERGLVPPAAFIPVAEETGLIIPLGRWVLEEACRQGARWQSHPGFRITVNLSARQLDDASLEADVSAAIAASGLDPRRLVLEITESALMRDAASALDRLTRLRALGVQLAVDDFGTGYSSLSYLQRLPITVLKIDRAFVAGLTHGGNDAALARTIIALGGTLDLMTVAEGIEEADQHARLCELGCRLGQGFLFARPMPADELDAMLARPVSYAAPPEPALHGGA